MFNSVYTYTMEEFRILTVIFVTSQILYVYTYSDTHTQICYSNLFILNAHKQKFKTFNYLSLTLSLSQSRYIDDIGVCVCECVRVFVTNQDIDLYNDTGMTQVLQGEGDFSGH